MTVIKGKGYSGATSGEIKLIGGITETPTYYATGYGEDKKSILVNNVIPVVPSGKTAFSVVGDSGCPVFYYDGNVAYLFGFVSAGNDDISLISGITDIIDFTGGSFIPYLG